MAVRAGRRLVAPVSARGDGRMLLLAAGLALGSPGAQAQAGIVFTPHLSEYAKLARGGYADHTLIVTRIEQVYDREGNVVDVGTPNVPDGESIDAALLLLRYLWVGNLFEHTGVPLLNEHDQLFRVIGNLGWQQSSSGIAQVSRQFGQRSGASGIGDLYLLAGLYGGEYRWGPFKGNDLWAFTYKWPIGDYDQDSLLNIGTHYPSYTPQFAHHQEWFGRLFVDATFAWQFNGQNDEPSYGGLTPTEPADVRSLEVNFSWKFNDRWFAELGLSDRRSIGPNRYGKVGLGFTDPIPPTTLCNFLGVPANQCSVADNFRLAPVEGLREDRGVELSLLTVGGYYIYRASSVFNLRLAIPVRGRGGQFDMTYNVEIDGLPGVPISQETTTLNAVQEAGSVSASPYLEMRFVYLFWAP